MRAAPLYRLLLLTTTLLPALALAAPASDAEINRLLSASRAQAMLSTLLPQMEANQKQQFEQVLQHPGLSAAQKQQVQALFERTRQTMQQRLAWSQLRPVYLAQYRQHFSREDILAMAEFYESDAGQRMLDKTPELMAGTSAGIERHLAPHMQQLQRELEGIIASKP
ncbi:hypothetical protein ABB30_06275 [Stenotrophomonas ginsengisoli]|uniref:DUF2059 domain-containing protein n=1 Tax=Stenotrophomonas ginsengisoli TaxID=336566 RepID=A0A0R0DIN4_9GAMM|nr:DUF2059 domain-containing protein [Stenotrophomonas ginsengisoli]KRG78001.1 hypothetical protein ABB30_06275 [Stenotrophomonas ginsengisoli]